MAKQTINIGSAADDGNGDTLRDAFDKSNDNFTELYDGQLTVGTTSGTVAAGDDSRLSDARAPTDHSHTLADVTDFDAANYATAAQGAKADSALQSLPTHSHTLSDITDVPANPIASKSFWTGTQAAYDALTPDADTLYFIEDES